MRSFKGHALPINELRGNKAIDLSRMGLNKSELIIIMAGILSEIIVYLVRGSETGSLIK